MKWFGPVFEIKRTDSKDALEYELIRNRRGSDIALVLAFLIAALVALCWRNFVWAFGLLVASSVFFYQLRSQSIYLRITGKGLQSSSVPFPAVMSYFAWETIRGLEYRAGGEDQDSGLWLRRGWGDSVCFVPDIERESAEQMIGEIYRRFPSVTMAEDSGPTSLFGKFGETIRLGLTDRVDKKNS